MKTAPKITKKDRGFTLIELLVVLVVIGILSTTLAPKFMGVGDSASASGMIQTADNASQMWAAIRQTARVSGNTTSNPMANTNNSIIDILYGGVDYVASAYQTKYRKSGVSTLNKALEATTLPVASTSAGAYSYEGYVLSFTSPNASSLGVQFDGVATEILELIHSEIGSGTFAAATAVTAGNLQYTATASGLHTVTIINNI